MIPSHFDIQNIRGKVFVIGDNIDTDQIIPANFLNLVPTNPEEYKKLGSYALYGLPEVFPRYVVPGSDTTEFAVILAGKNFGCGSSREHAPISLGAAGCRIVLAQSYARIFFRNCIATGELFPVEYAPETPLLSVLKTGDSVSINLMDNTLTAPDGTVYPLRDPGDVRDVIVSGGIFEFARQSGIVKRS